MTETADRRPQPIYPASAEDLPSPQEVARLSGLEFMGAVRDGKLPAAPIARTLRFTLEVVEEGRAVFRGEPHLEVCNPIGSVHGGWYGTLLDSAMGCAVHTKLPRGRTYTTLEYKVNVLRGARLGCGPLLAIGETVHVGRTTAIAEGRLVGEADGKVYATGSTTCLIMDFG